MGMILSFTPRAATGRLPKPAAAPAAVIIFPGVRYEHPRDAACGGGPPPSRPPLDKPVPRH